MVVFRYLMQMTGSSHDAEELTQETFLRGLQANLTSEVHPRAWLLKVARNAWLDVARRRTAVKFESLPAQHSASATDVSNAVDITDETVRVRAALAELTELARMVFLMRVEGELSFSEIAAALDSTEEACRWHMHQARSKLLKRLTTGD
ncbi:hypothetical protein BH11PLA2_BH11PLA2_25310 [soil metagenome]